MTIKAVIFDYRAILRSAHHLTEVRDLLTWCTGRGLSICVFTTDPLDVLGECAQLNLPRPVLHLQRTDVNKNRGSNAWVDLAAARMGLQPNQLFYVGTSNRDWRTAINSAVMFCHAGWTGPQPSGTTCLVMPTADDVKLLISHYLLEVPRWSYALDDPGGAFALRALLPARALLPQDLSGTQFKLQDVFTRNRQVQVGSADARDLLVFHVISSAYLEGMLTRGAFFCVYPGSKPGTLSQQLASYVRPAASLVHGFYKADLLIRAVQAPDTSLARWQASQSGQHANISIATQATTVHVSPKYRGKLRDKTVVVFDDFTTAGMSIEWARSLLLAAGAANVIALTIGKYGGARHTEYRPLAGATLNPFSLNALAPNDFSESTATLAENVGNQARLGDIFMRHLRKVP